MSTPKEHIEEMLAMQTGQAIIDSTSLITTLHQSAATIITEHTAMIVRQLQQIDSLEGLAEFTVKLNSVLPK